MDDSPRKEHLRPPFAVVTHAWRATAPTLVAAILSMYGSVSGFGQTVVEIDDDIACPDCRIETGPPVVLAAPGDRLRFSSDLPPGVARDRSGNYIAGPLLGDALIAAFGPDGSYLSSHGRIGQGPGEFDSEIPLLIDVGEGDTIYAVNPPHLHTLAPRAEAALDKVSMPVLAFGAFVVLRDGIAVEAMLRTEDGITPVQILRRDGTISAGIGAVPSEAAPGEPSLRRILARSNDHVGVWSAPVNRYHLSRYGLDGEEKTRIERDFSSFRPGVGFAFGAPYQAPVRPGVSGILQDADGLLWVAVTQAPQSFTPLMPNAGRQQAEMPLPQGLDMNRFLNTTIEVLDPVAGQLLARRDFDEYVKFVRTADGGVFVFSLRADPLGGFECVVTPLSLQSG